MEQIMSFIDEYGTLITYLPTIIFVVIVVLWALRGMLKGFRKSTIQLIYMLIAMGLACLVFYIFTNDEGKLIYSICGANVDELLGVSMPNDYNSLFGTSVQASDITIVDSLSVYVFNIIANRLDGTANVPIEYYQFVEVIAVILLRVAVFIVAFLCYFVFKFILWIFYLIFFREGRHKRKLLRRNLRYRKRRLFGGLVGAVRGLIVGTCAISVFATTLYLITAGRSADETKFTDETIADVYDIDNLLKEMGDTGILSVFNDITVDDLPFYLFFANAIASAELGDSGEVVYIAGEITSISGLAQDLLALFNNYGGDYITIDSLTGDSYDIMDTLTDLFNSENKVLYEGESRTFKEALIYVIEQYDGSTYLNNLMKITIGTIVSNIDSFVDSEDNMAVGIIKAMFDSEDDTNYISPYDLVTFNDLKVVLIGLLDSMNEILDYYTYITTESITNLGLINRALAIVEPMSKAISELSIFTDYEEDTEVNGETVVSHKKEKMNAAISRAVDYAFTMVAESSEEEFDNPYTDVDVDWLSSFEAVLDSLSNVAVITTNVEEQLSVEDNNMTLAISNVFSEDYEYADEIDAAYEAIIEDLNNVEAVTILMNSEFMYVSLYDTLLNSVLSSMSDEEINLKYPRTIHWNDTIDEETGEIIEAGEFRVLFETLRNLIREGLLEAYASEEETLIKVNNIFGILLSTYDEETNETVLDYAMNSNIMYYTISLMLTNTDSFGFDIIIPYTDTYINVVEGVYLVQKNQIIDIIEVFKPLLEKFIDAGIVSLDGDGFDLSTVLDILQDEEVRTSIISSDILTATIGNYVVSTVEENDSLSLYIVIPDELIFSDDPSDETYLTAFNSWIGDDGEFANIFNSLDAMDIKLSTMVTGETDYDEMLKKILNLDEVYEDTNTRLDVVMESAILSRSLTYIMQTNETVVEYIYIPDEAYTDETQTLISNSEWLSLIKALKYSFGISVEGSILDQLTTFNALVSNLFSEEAFNNSSYFDYEDKKSILFSSIILEYSLVINIYSVLEDMDLGDSLTLIIPDYLSENDYADWLAIRDENKNILAYGELGNILDVFDVTGLGLAYASDNFSEEVGEIVSVNSLIVNSNDYDEDGNLIETKLVEKQEKQKALTNSVVLSATTLNTIISTNAVSIPTRYQAYLGLDYDEDGNYSYDEVTTPTAIKENYNSSLQGLADEILKILEALNELKLTISEDDANTIVISANLVLTLNDTSDIVSGYTKIEVILESELISLTLTEQMRLALTDVDFEEIAVETNYNALDYENDIYEGNDEDLHITAAEWTRMINALDENGLGLSADGADVSEQIQDAVSLLNSLLGDQCDLLDDCEDDLVYYEKRNNILSSYIVEEVIRVKVLESLEFDEASNTDTINNVVVPEDTVWHLERNEDGTVATGATSELTVLLDTLKILGLGEITSEDFADYNTYINENLQVANVLVVANDDDKEHKEALQDKLLQSHILHATMINIILDFEYIVKPEVLTDAGKIDSETCLEDTRWYINEELQKLFNTTELLLTKDEDGNITFNVDDILSSLVSSDEENPLDLLIESSLSYLTVSSSILTVIVSGSDVGLYLPYDLLVNLNTELGYYDYVIESSELQYFFNDLASLGVTTISTGIDLSVPNADILSAITEFKSEIIRGLLSYAIISSQETLDYIDYSGNNSISNITYVVYDIDNNSYDESEDIINIFSSEELISFLKVISSMDKDDFSFSISNIDDLANLDAELVLESDIICSIISDFLINITYGHIEAISGEAYELTVNSQTINSSYEYVTKEIISNYLNSNS